MRVIRSIFGLICLGFTGIGVLYLMELLIKLISISHCVDMQQSGNGYPLPEQATSAATPKSIDDKGNARILIWVLTGPSRHMSHVWHVKRTWGAHFDKLLFMSSQKDDRLGTIALSNVTEGHEKLWPKTQKAFQYVWEHHKDDADWFMKADDDTFVVSHNLRDFVNDLNPNEPHYIGFDIKWHDVPVPVNYGGTGYILSKAALRLFIEALERGGDCHTEIRKKYKGDEDTELGICMASMNVTAEEAVDSEGRKRMIMVGSVDDFDNAVTSFNGKWPLDHSEWSPRAISFHSISRNQMYVLEHVANTMRMI